MSWSAQADKGFGEEAARQEREGWEAERGVEKAAGPEGRLGSGR